MKIDRRLNPAIGYGGALIVFPIIYLKYYNNITLYSTLLLVLWVSHFGKRIAENIWVHIHTEKTIEISMCIGMWIYYIGFGYWNAEALFQSMIEPNFMSTIATLLFIACSAGNGICHYMLRKLKLDNPNRRTYPRGFLFEYVSCPHYFCEIMMWFAFTLLTRTFAAATFFVATLIILSMWSKERHEKYKKMDGFPSSRKSLVPFLY
mmetsp:Transcript_4103/g.6082  ORF Transcript_4103/g.6082 Transcript_4103/m.6082 type:complete len:206 (+) Transcript_4103:11-628(+)